MHLKKAKHVSMRGRQQYKIISKSLQSILENLQLPRTPPSCTNQHFTARGPVTTEKNILKRNLSLLGYTGSLIRY